jgi:hypothetical protein
MSDYLSEKMPEAVVGIEGGVSMLSKFSAVNFE